MLSGVDEDAQGDAGAVGPKSIRESKNTQPSGLRFRAVLAEGGAARLAFVGL